MSVYVHHISIYIYIYLNTSILYHAFMYTYIFLWLFLALSSRADGINRFPVAQVPGKICFTGLRFLFRSFAFACGTFWFRLAGKTGFGMWLGNVP